MNPVRLLYLSDVPPEQSCHGSMLMFRLLQGWPAAQVRLLLPNYATTTPAMRLPGVSYDHFFAAVPRLLRTRYTRLYEAFVARRAVARGGHLLGRVRAMQADVILTVAHGYAWITAAAVARALSLPLIVIVHDDWPRCHTWVLWTGSWIDRELRCVLHQAAAVFSVSPFMARDYEKRYQISSQVMYPARGEDCPQFTEPAPMHRERCNIAFAGTIASRGYGELLKSAAAAAAGQGGRLLLFSGVTQALFEQQGLHHPAIEYRGLMPSPDMIRALRNEADFLYVPMSFAAIDAPNMEKSFPSKLTDYTAVGVPILVQGPPACSAVHWARDHPDVAAVVTDSSGAALSQTMADLLAAPERRQTLARNALELGASMFDPRVAAELLHAALSRVLPDTHAPSPSPSSPQSSAQALSIAL